MSDGELLIVDRIENGMAACETAGHTLRHIPLDQLPEGVKEGDCLWQEGNRYRLDHGETQRRRDHNRRLFHKLKNRGGKTS